MQITKQSHSFFTNVELFVTQLAIERELLVDLSSRESNAFILLHIKLKGINPLAAQPNIIAAPQSKHLDLVVHRK